MRDRQLKERAFSILLLLLLILAALAGCASEPEEKPDSKSEDAVTGQVQYAGMECVTVETDAGQILKTYLAMLDEGKKEGFTPLVIFRDSRIMDEMLSFCEEDYGSLAACTEEILRAYPAVDVEAFLRERRDSYRAFLDEIGEWAADSETEVEKQQELAMYGYDEIYIAKVPTDKPYELFAYLPVSGFNECPPPETMIAVAKGWYEKYGALPCAIGYDTVQFYLPEPVTSRPEAEAFAEEMFLVCPDMVDQGVLTLDNLTESVLDSHFQFFWWD